MGRFNTPTVNSTKATEIVNLAGGKAYSQSAELELVSMLLTSFVQDQYYRTANDGMKRLIKLMNKVQPAFAAKAAIYARHEFGMRSITHVLAAELAKKVSGQPWAKDFYTDVIFRVDDMTEILAYYFGHGNKSLSKSMQKGFAKAFEKFDAYQLAKYRGEGKEISLMDAANIIHPAPVEHNGIVEVSKSDYVKILESSISHLEKNKKKNAEKEEFLNTRLKEINRIKKDVVPVNALEALMLGMLKNEKTWEAQLTEAGKQAESESEKAELKSNVWKDMLEKKQLGYTALVRNLRNIVEQAPDAIELACATLKNENMIAKSKIMPFQLILASKEIHKMNSSKTNRIIESLDDALDISCANVPKFDGKTLVVCDYSGSMDAPISNMGTIERREVGSLFAAIMAKANDSDFMIFGTTASYVPFNRKDSITSIYKDVDKHNRNDLGYGVRRVTGVVNVAHGTDFTNIFKIADKAYDRIFVFSDCQGWQNGGAPIESQSAYEKKFGCKPSIYSFDLAGAGSNMWPEKKVYALAGFSEKIFDILKMMEQDRNALVNTIKNYRNF
jgi:hypothetical protein